jgi:ATP-binding cassette subfamily B protein
VSLIEIYYRALGYLAAEKQRVFFICSANIVLAAVAIIEPILFGRIIDAITDKQDVVLTLALWAGLGVFNIVAFVLVARGADRVAHELRARVTTEAYEKLITMPLAWHQKRGSSTALHTLLRAMESLFSLWLEFMRLHLATAVALVLLVPTAIAMDLRMSLVLVVLGILYFGISRFVMKKTKEGQASVERHYHTVFAHIGDTVTNVGMLQAYGRIADETRRLRRLASDLVAAQKPVLDWWGRARARQRV